MPLFMLFTCMSSVVLYDSDALIACVCCWIGTWRTFGSIVPGFVSMCREFGIEVEVKMACFAGGFAEFYGDGGSALLGGKLGLLDDRHWVCQGQQQLHLQCTSCHSLLWRSST
ncbi:hypothetical protein KC19_1G075400 [Ceratodon purpureus]|uniref:Secreted protein n=1 Tax=Ceratodon purpureus TaxID=3225 RepID=A0A8T0J519_CERPU|nr:hypothetical protein KC19_1G075400 [Ceratodon purpureus]